MAKPKTLRATKVSSTGKRNAAGAAKLKSDAKKGAGTSGQGSASGANDPKQGSTDGE